MGTRHLFLIDSGSSGHRRSVDGNEILASDLGGILDNQVEGLHHKRTIPRQVSASIRFKTKSVPRKVEDHA